jgi:hypothetical protein
MFHGTLHRMTESELAIFCEASSEFSKILSRSGWFKLFKVCLFDSRLDWAPDMVVHQYDDHNLDLAWFVINLYTEKSIFGMEKNDLCIFEFLHGLSRLVTEFHVKKNCF